MNASCPAACVKLPLGVSVVAVPLVGGAPLLRARSSTVVPFVPLVPLVPFVPFVPLGPVGPAGPVVPAAPVAPIGPRCAQLTACWPLRQRVPFATSRRVPFLLTQAWKVPALSGIEPEIAA